MRNKYYFVNLVVELLRIGIYDNFQDLLFYIDLNWRTVPLHNRGKKLSVRSELDSIELASLGLSYIADVNRSDATKLEAITACFRSLAIQPI